MTSRRTGLLMVVLAFGALAACGSDDSAAPRTKNSALSTTTVASAATTTAPSASSTTPTVAMSASIDLASLRPSLPAEMASDGPAAVSSSLQTDPDGILSVSAAAWGSGAGLRSLDWTVSAGGRSVQCSNCAFLSDSMRRIVREVLSGSAGRKVVSVRGFDPSVTAPGDPRGLGWAAEFLVADTDSGNDVVDWVLACPTETSCRSSAINAGEMLWRNQFWGIDESCDESLASRGPTEAYPNADLSSTDPIEQRAFGLDRVMIAAPEYVGVYESSADIRRLTGWRETGCSS